VIRQGPSPRLRRRTRSPFQQTRAAGDAFHRRCRRSARLSWTNSRCLLRAEGHRATHDDQQLQHASIVAADAKINRASSGEGHHDDGEARRRVFTGAVSPHRRRTSFGSDCQQIHAQPSERNASWMSARLS
jgi:hypothetical protein